MSPWYEPFVYRLRENAVSIFSLRNLRWHALAIALTGIIVVTGADWSYFNAAYAVNLLPFAMPAAILGFFIPLLLPLILPFARDTRVMAYALVQAEALAWLLSAFYKMLTGRLHPVLAGGGTDISHTFYFGFFRGGIFWGWPSSHTTVAFALAAVIVILSKRLSIRVLAILYALFIAVGVSVSIHWLSDAVAGVIFGTLAGVIVARSYTTYHIAPPVSL